MKQLFSAPRSRLALKGGSYCVAVSAIVLAILIALNLLVSALPASLTKLDISASQLYSITSNTKAIVNNLQQEVTIYWVVQADEEDSILQNLLEKYESISSYVSVVKKNPDVYPTFTEQYTDEEVPNNSLIVTSGERYRYVSYSDIYETEFDYNTYSYVTSGFDGEGAITSAIDYVVTEDLPQLYMLQGHGEADLPEALSESIEKENLALESLSLPSVDEIPAEADALLLYAPQSDLSEQEAEMLSTYVADGGKLLVISGPVDGVEFTNLHSLLQNYNITVVDGLVIEGNRSNYAFGYPYLLMPELESSSITDALISARYSPILPLAQGLQVSNTAAGTVTSLMTTSDEAFSKLAGFALNTYEKEDDDVDGPFSLAVSIASNGGGQLVWFSSSDFVNEPYNAYSSGANLELVMNALGSLVGEREALSIRSKSLNYNYLTINETTSATLKALMIGVFPLAYLGVGICVIARKRGKQNETL